MPTGTPVTNGEQEWMKASPFIPGRAILNHTSKAPERSQGIKYQLPTVVSNKIKHLLGVSAFPVHSDFSLYLFPGIIFKLN